MFSCGMTSFEKVGRSGGDSGKANLVNPVTVEQAKVVLTLSTTDISGQISLCCGKLSYAL